ncbi:hypothetical protein N9H34_00570 [bacterium]|nr:hypothetical protein [bacterium]
MALTVELTVTRPNTETSWPWSGTDASVLTQLESLRETHGATSSTVTSEDGLTSVFTESCPIETGDDYFAEYSNIWQTAGNTAASTGVTISSIVIDNT